MRCLLKNLRSLVFSLCFCSLISASSGNAQTSQIVGEWSFIISGAQPWTINSYDPSNGEISGFGAANGYQWTFSGTALNGTFSINYVYTNLPSYFGTLTGTFADDCNLVSGTWTSSFGQVGNWTGTKVNCGGTGGGPSGQKDPTSIGMFCNRTGPNLDTASCAVTVADSGPPPRKTPTGSVDFAASGGFFPGAASCVLQQTPYSPGIASCIAYFQVPFGFPIATPLPVEAVYNGDSEFDSSATSHQLIQAGCIGTPEAPCPGSVALSFADIPQIIDGLLSSVVSCGGAVTGAAKYVAKSTPPTLAATEFEGECDVDLGATISAANEMANMEEQALLEEFATQLEQSSTKSLSQLEKIFFQALAKTAQLMATNQQTYDSHINNPTQIQQTIKQEMQSIFSKQPAPLVLKAKKKDSKLSKKQIKPILLQLNDRSAVVKVNKQKVLKQKLPKSTRVLLSALKKAGVGTVAVALKLKSTRLGKLPKGVKRKGTVSTTVNVGLTSVQ